MTEYTKDFSDGVDIARGRMMLKELSWMNELYDLKPISKMKYYFGVETAAEAFGGKDGKPDLNFFTPNSKEALEKKRLRDETR